MKISKFLIFLIVISFISYPSFAQDSLNGKYFPLLKGESLSGNNVELPKDSIGKITFVILGFSYKASENANVWLNKFEKKYGKDKNINFYLIPMMGNKTSTKTMSFLINSAMRSGTPKAEHDHVVTVYEDLEPIKNSISFTKDEDIYVYLINKDGKIAWNSRGKFNRETFRNMENILNSIN